MTESRKIGDCILNVMRSITVEEEPSTHPRPRTRTRRDVSDWTIRLGEKLDPYPISNEVLWDILETAREELVDDQG